MSHESTLVAAPLRAALEDVLGRNTVKMAGGIFQEGIPDILVPCPDGQFCFIECKRGLIRDGQHAINVLEGMQKPRIVKWGMLGLPVFLASLAPKGTWLLFDYRCLGLGMKTMPCWPIEVYESPQAWVARFNDLRWLVPTLSNKQVVYTGE
jgi:hypothetical protein